MEAVVLVYYVYKKFWDTAAREELSCLRELGNCCDLYD